MTPDGKLLDTDFPDPFAGGEYLGHLPFSREAESDPIQPGQRVGKGHNARRIVDLASLLTPEGRRTPTDLFYIRTEYPDQLQAPAEWTISIEGEVKEPKKIPLKNLLSAVESQGPVLLECSGNARDLRYGLLSVADWAGISMKEIIRQAQPTSKAQSILIGGYDEDSHLPLTQPPYKTHSWPTCSWIFTIDQLVEAGAFLATQLNGVPLPKDQGASVRLVVPGWYGCVEVKWVNQIKFVDDNEPATLQMQEFASRTFQKMHLDESNPQPPGLAPELARDYRPATIDQVAIPVRAEAWRLMEKSNIACSASPGAAQTGPTSCRSGSFTEILRNSSRFNSARARRRVRRTESGAITGNPSGAADIGSKCDWAIAQFVREKCHNPTRSGATIRELPRTIVQILR